MCNQPSGGGNRKRALQNQQYLLCLWLCSHLSLEGSELCKFTMKGVPRQRAYDSQEEDDHSACWTVHWWFRNYEVKIAAHSLVQAGLWGMKGSDFWRLRDTTLDWSLLEIWRNMSPESKIRIHKWVIIRRQMGLQWGRVSFVWSRVIVLRHQQVGARAIQSGTCRSDAETRWTSVVFASLISPAFPSY